MATLWTIVQVILFIIAHTNGYCNDTYEQRSEYNFNRYYCYYCNVTQKNGEWTVEGLDSNLYGVSYNRIIIISMQNLKFSDFTLQTVITDDIAFYFGIVELIIEDSQIDRIVNFAFPKQKSSEYGTWDVKYRFVSFKNNNISTIEENAFNNFKSDTKVSFSNNVIGNKIGTITSLSILVSVTSLDLSNNNLTSISNELFTANKNFQYLNLSNSQIKHIVPNAFIYLSKLEVLDLSMNMLLNVHQCDLLNLKDTSYIFHNLSALHTLILFGNNISNFDNALGYLPLLQKLDLSHQNFSSLSNKMFPEISAIKYLNISNNQINQINPNTFVNMQNLEHLDLSHNQIKNMHIASLHGLSNLQSLNLSYNHYTIDKYLIFNTPQLSFLDISYNNVSDIDVTLFKGSHLSSINIDGMQLSCTRLVEIVKYFKTLNINCVAGKEQNRLHLFGMHCNHSDVIESTTMQNVIESTNIPNSDIQLSNNKILSEVLNVLKHMNNKNLNANLTQGINIQLSNNKILTEMLNVLNRNNDKNLNANLTQGVNIQLSNNKILTEMLNVLKHNDNKNLTANPTQVVNQVHDVQEKSDKTTHVLFILLILLILMLFLILVFLPYIWRKFDRTNQYVPTENLITDFELSNR